MIPKHDKTNHLLKSGLLDNLKKFSDLEKRISKLPTEKERGDALEVFAEAYLATQTILQAKEVWTFDSVPPSLKRKFKLDSSRDMGVDGLLKTKTGEHHAYQVKFRSGRPSLTWTELSTFIGLADKTDQKLIFTNCNRIPPVLEKRDDVYCVRGNDLDRLEEQNIENILNWLKKRKGEHKPKQPWDFQQEAVDAIAEALEGNNKRATAIMACATGKTLIALWLAEQSGYKKILVLVPSLALLSQTLHEWMKETSLDNLSYVCVCSDPTVTKGVDNWVVRPSDLDFPVGTDSDTVIEFLSKRTGGVKVIFSTYQSAHVVAEGLNTKSGFDLAIFDEAHKTAGRQGAKFAFALDDKNLPIKRRLFLTATPKHYNVLKKDKEGESTLVYSMDDQEIYGPRVYELPFGEAAERDIICGYKVLISVVTSDEVNEEFLRRGAVLVEGDEVKARQVASQMALKRASEKYPINKAFTFHTFVDSAKSFTSEGGEGLHSHLPEFETFHVNGSMPTAKREELLREFEDSKRAVMSNARCLTEGVNVPVVDMVAFMSPKRSRIDIVQATGRAMRKAGIKKKGYILIPLFLQQVKRESIEEALERTDFKEVWYVLQAMQEQDEELAEVISQAVFEKGKKQAKGYDDHRFVEKVEVLGLNIGLDRLRKAIATRCIEKLGVSWDFKYGELVAYKEEYGDCNVPRGYSYNPQLGAWVDRQRYLYRKNKLGNSKIERLEIIGFVWEPYEVQWEAKYQELLNYKEEHGDCNVPWKYLENPELGYWVYNQRQFYRNNELSKDKINKLEQLGFVWDPFKARWEEMYRELKKYKNKQGHCNVPRGYKENPKLDSWVLKQRQDYKNGRLSKDRTNKLEQLGFVWNYREAQWEKMYQELASFKREHGHCNVPKETSKLGRWVGVQRIAYKRNRLSKDRIERLNKLGLAWNTLEAQWDEMYKRLEAYKEVNGNSNVSREDSENRELAGWVLKQRQDYRKGKLSQDRFKKLEKLGFVWNALEAQWEERYQELVKYRIEHGNCNVPAKYSANPKLGGWVSKQRQDYQSGRLSKARITRLEKIGFGLRKSVEQDWDRMYQQLVDYKAEHGDCNVPSNHIGNPRLGRWVSTQRQEYKKGRLDEDRINKLEKLVFVWNTIEFKWNDMFQKLVEYKKENGNCNVPPKYNQNQKLGNWVGTQRYVFRKGKLSKGRIDRLEKLGFEWEPKGVDNEDEE